MLTSATLMGFIATTDATQARHFFESILGLTLVSDEPYALVFEVNGATLRVQKVQSLTPGAYTALGWQVADVKTIVAGLTGRGVIFERFNGFEQDDLGIYTFQDGTLVAWFKDPDGNLLSLTQMP